MPSSEILPADATSATIWDDQGRLCLTLRFSTRADRDDTIREITVALSRATAIVKAL
jgi:hypothetical protein